jgi:hypothetical protein
VPIESLKIKGVVMTAPWIEWGDALRTTVITREVCRNGKRVTAGSAQHSEFVELVLRPTASSMNYRFIMTVDTPIERLAALQTYRNDIERAPVVLASRLRVHTDSPNPPAMQDSDSWSRCAHSANPPVL